MTRQEFLDGLAGLVGPGRGYLARGARLLGVSVGTVRAVACGNRPVPPAYAARLRAAEADSEARGAAVPFVDPRLQAVVRDAVEAGWPEADAWAAVAACAALRLAGGR